MEFLSVLSLIVTLFCVVYYCYIANNSEVSPAFFLCVGIFCYFANLAAISAGAWFFSIVFLIVDAIFLGVGFAIDFETTIDFYTAIGPWCVKTFTNTAMIGWQVLSFVVFPVGIVLYFVWDKKNPELAATCGKMGLFGILFFVSVLWLALGMVSGLAVA